MSTWHVPLLHSLCRINLTKNVGGNFMGWDGNVKPCDPLQTMWLVTRIVDRIGCEGSSEEGIVLGLLLQLLGH